MIPKEGVQKDRGSRNYSKTGMSHKCVGPRLAERDLEVQHSKACLPQPHPSDLFSQTKPCKAGHTHTHTHPGTPITQPVQGSELAAPWSVQAIIIEHREIWHPSLLSKGC